MLRPIHSTQRHRICEPLNYTDAVALERRKKHLVGSLDIPTFPNMHGDGNTKRGAGYKGP